MWYLVRTLKQKQDTGKNYGDLNKLWTCIKIGAFIVTDVSYWKALLAFLPRQEVDHFGVRGSRGRGTFSGTRAFTHTRVRAHTHTGP